MEKMIKSQTPTCPNKEPKQIIHKQQRENHKYQSAPNSEKEPNLKTRENEEKIWGSADGYLLQFGAVS